MDEFEKFYAQTQQKALKVAALILFAAFLFLPFWPSYMMRILLGLLMGFAISILVFRMRARGLLKLARMDKDGAKRYAVSRFFFRYGLMGIAVIALARSGLINAVACVLGLFLVNAVEGANQVREKESS